MASSLQYGSPPFVGRASELATLSAALDDAFADRGSLVLLAGESGIGKSCLSEELARLAQQRGARVIWGRSFEAEGAPAFWPWLQILRVLLQDRDAGDRQPTRTDTDSLLAQLLPDLDDRRTERRRTPTGPPAAISDPAQARFRQFDAITGTLMAASRERPLVLLLDDLHWADTPSLLLLQFLTPHVRDAALLVVGAYRDEEISRGHPLNRTLAELARVPYVQRLVLHGLAAPDVARCIEQTAGIAPSPDLAAAVAQRTEGNPLFVIEIARFLVSEGRLRRDASPQGFQAGGGPPPAPAVEPFQPGGRLLIPPSIRDVVGRRLDRLSTDCERMLAIAGVIGREFDVVTLERAGEFDAVRILALLERAETARVVTPVVDVPGRYRFAHALIRETLYDELPGARRVLLHHQVGEALAAMWYPDDDAHLAELAHHFVQAAPSAGSERAVTYSRRAGDRALRLLAYEEAVAQYQTALRMVALGESDDPSLRCELLLALGEAQTRAGDFAPARETLREAATLARVLGKGEILARAAVSIATGVRMGGVDPELIDLMKEAVAVLSTEESPLRVQALAGLATALFWSDGDATSRASVADEAVSIGRRVGDAATLARALAAWCLAAWRPDNLSERLAAATKILPLAREAGDPDLALHSHAWRTICLLELGDLAAANAAIAAFEPLGEELRQPRYRWATPVRSAMLALLTGRFAEVEPLAQQALAIGQRARHSDAPSAYFSQLYALRREQGRLAELEAAVLGIVARAPAAPVWHVALALLYTELNRTEEARREFELVAAGGFAALPFDGNWLFLACLLAEICAALGDDRRAATLYAMLLPYAGRCTVVSGAAVCGGAVSRHLGQLAAVRQRWDDASRHFEDALSLHERIGARPWSARTACDHASALLERLRQRPLFEADSVAAAEKARNLLDRAFIIASALDHTAVLMRVAAIQAELEALAASSQSFLASQPEPLPDGLTVREAEVLHLLAGGALNREIADALVVSVRTVERHLLHIYSKIGARRRADAVAYALSHGLG
jgi:DNA-binding CsgD family transcriptional regulator